ncbi:hypothetical protein L0F63_000695 [Massospora cicadina]|nr:hypothetical protein L0F63_000695 [Massospora cicadina]
MVLSVLKAENLEMEDLKLICSQLGDIVYNDSKRHPQLGELTVALGNLRDEEFASRLNLALSRPLITSDVVIQMLWDTCINRPTSTAILAARLPALMEKLVDYVYISKPPVPNGLDPMKRKAIDLMACLRHTEADGSHGDIGAFTDSVETLRKLYTTLSLPLSKMLLEIDPVRCDIFNSKIIVKYIHTYVKASEYYEGYIDPKTTPLLHTRLKQLADRHFILRPEIVSCFFECLKAPSPTARRSTTGKANIYGILNHIVAFMRLGEEQLVIRLFKENVSIIDDEALTHAIKTIFCSIRPPFTISFVHWMCEWLIHVANHSRHLVLQSGILNKFLILTQSPVNLIPTPYHPNIKQTLISMIGQLNTIASGK